MIIWAVGLLEECDFKTGVLARLEAGKWRQATEVSQKPFLNKVCYSVLLVEVGFERILALWKQIVGVATLLLSMLDLHGLLLVSNLRVDIVCMRSIKLVL